MKMNNGDPSDLIVVQSEVITILLVKSIGIADLVNYSLNGTAFPGTKPKSEPCIFQVQTSSILSVTLHYVADQGGNFSIQTTGSGGGDVSIIADSQADGEAFGNVTYTFTVQ